MSNRRSDYEDDGFYRALPRAENLTIKREIIAVPLMILALLILLGVLFVMGFIRFPYYQAQAAQNRITRITLAPPRGEILDRKGKPLAVNHAGYDCYFISSDDMDADVTDLTRLGEFLGLSGEKLETVLEGRREAGSIRSMASELWAAGRGTFGAKSILVKRDLNQVEVTAILERRTEFPSTFLERAYRRSYPAGECTAQVIGYVGQISESDLDEWERLGYRGGDMVGKAGLERQYDKYLRGRPGEKLVAVDARGRILGEAEMIPAVVPDSGAVVVRGDDVVLIREGEVIDLSGGVRVSMRESIVKAVESGFASVDGDERAVIRTLFEDSGHGGNFGEWHVFRRTGEIACINEQVVMRPSIVPPIGGSPLRLTIDLDMQRAIDEILGDHVGGVIAMDPRDGSILAMVSEPGYDPNLFFPGGVDPEGWLAILDDPHCPLLNRPVQNAYVPGSTFKIVTALAAAEENMTHSSWTCRGSIEVGNRKFRCWKLSGHGHVDFTRAIAESCDVAFWEMAQSLGHEKIYDMSRELGLGGQLGIDLPEEVGGLIPDDAWKRARFGDAERWFTGDTMNMAIGQGFVQLTVLQVAQITAVVANGGYLVPPHLNRLLTPAPSTIERISVSDRNINAVRAGLRSCVTTGTGRGCNLDWIDIAGKTGTADDPPREEPHSWFTSYGPYSDPSSSPSTNPSSSSSASSFAGPSLVIVVFCENGGHGDEKAVPLTRQIWECDAVRAYLGEE